MSDCIFCKIIRVSWLSKHKIYCIINDSAEQIIIREPCRVFCKKIFQLIQKSVFRSHIRFFNPSFLNQQTQIILKT